MKIDEFPLNEREKLLNALFREMEAITQSYEFPSPYINETPLSQEEIDQLGLDIPFNTEFTISYDKKTGMIYISNGEDMISINLDSVRKKRTINLLNEATFRPSPEPPYSKIPNRIVAECGYSLDLLTLLRTITYYQITTFIGARPSCGAADLIVEHDGFEDANISTVGFLTEDGDIIEVLYLGKYTSEVEFIHRVVLRLCSSPEFNIEYKPITEL